MRERNKRMNEGEIRKKEEKYGESEVIGREKKERKWREMKKQIETKEERKEIE